MIIPLVYANEIRNDALPASVRTGTAGAGLAFYIGQLWKTMVILGGLAFLIFLIWGSLEWLLSGGDKNKVENAQHKISNALVGLAILVASFAIVKLVEGIFKINLLAPEFSNNI